MAGKMTRDGCGEELVSWDLLRRIWPRDCADLVVNTNVMPPAVDGDPRPWNGGEVHPDCVICTEETDTSVTRNT